MDCGHSLPGAPGILLGRAIILLSIAFGPHPPAGGQKPAIPGAGAWRSSTVHDAGCGVWTLGAGQIFREYASPEVVTLDDRGRATVLVGYSGAWTALPALEDREWLGALAVCDVRAGEPGGTIFTGGKRGNLYRVRCRAGAAPDVDLLARFPGEEIHALAVSSGDSGESLLVFTHPGRVYEVPAAGRGDPSQPYAPVLRMRGRVRQALRLPGRPEIAAVSRAGEIALLRWDPGAVESSLISLEPSGVGRLAVMPSEPGSPLVLYACRDDGVILRLEETGGRRFRREILFAGPEGPRGIAAGRFDADPARETLAVFGYSKRVQLLSRNAAGGFDAETIFEDADKGHWLMAAELDGRNGTDEILGSGYSGRVFLLSRDPGYGLPGVAADRPGHRESPDAAAGRPPAPAEDGAGGETAPPARRALRIAIAATRTAGDALSPLSYGGGFETKSLVYETLVRRDEEGRITGALAKSFETGPDGRTFRFTLREDAVFHDGSPVTPEAVCQHLRRWVLLPEHAWLPAARFIESFRPAGPGAVEIRLDRPWSLLSDLCAINPAAVRAPASLDRQGAFQWPVGSGPFRLESKPGDGARLLYRRTGANAAAPRLLELVPHPSGPGEILRKIRAGDLDAAVNGWYELVPVETIPDVESDPALHAISGPGSSVVYLSFGARDGKPLPRSLRRAVAASIDRERLCRETMRGMADPATGFMAPTVRIWPAGRAQAPPDGPPAAPANGIRILAPSSDARQDRLARAVAEQLRAAGIAASAEAVEPEQYARRVEAMDFDLRLETTWGVPYDPDITLANRFLPGPGHPSAAEHRYRGVPGRLRELVQAALSEPDEPRRIALYEPIQRFIEEEAPVVPLLVPRRVAVLRRGTEPFTLDHDLYRLPWR